MGWMTSQGHLFCPCFLHEAPKWDLGTSPCLIPQDVSPCFCCSLQPVSDAGRDSVKVVGLVGIKWERWQGGVKKVKFSILGEALWTEKAENKDKPCGKETRNQKGDSKKIGMRRSSLSSLKV